MPNPAGPVLETTPKTHVLFLDLLEIQELGGVVQTVTEAEKHPLNPVLPLGDLHEWDSVQASPWQSRSVIYDEEARVFKCWYAGTGLFKDPTHQPRWIGGYATSPDGIHWKKPNLGLCEYNGNKANNICFPDWFGPVIKDNSEPDPEKRYKMIIQNMKRAPGSPEFQIGYSADGIHWSKGQALDVAGLGHPVAFIKDESALDPNRRYLLFGQVSDSRANRKPGLDKSRSSYPDVRAKCLAYGPDETHWTFSEANPVLTPFGSSEHENHFLQIIPYSGFYILLYEYGWFVPDGYGLCGTYGADIRLAVSRDGEHYQRVQSHQKVIRRGRYGEWDDGFLVISDKAVIKDDTLYLFYCGQGHEWTSWPSGDNLPRRGEILGNSGCIRLSRMGLATLPLDRFTCLETKDSETPGYMVTRPIRVVDPARARLTVNVGSTIPRRNWIAVEVLDAESQVPIAGFQAAECCPVDEDGLRIAVRWGGRDSFVGIEARHIALRFWFYGGVRLYSFAF
ncbi:MAG: hypothetical protein FJY97_06990 [candidate division Zixibacteria bacterium]|nr:hypothetical protein [candidate division Zixibacteria bacterium]